MSKSDFLQHFYVPIFFPGAGVKMKHIGSLFLIPPPQISKFFNPKSSSQVRDIVRTWRLIIFMSNLSLYQNVKLDLARRCDFSDHSFTRIYSRGYFIFPIGKSFQLEKVFPIEKSLLRTDFFLKKSHT